MDTSYRGKLSVTGKQNANQGEAIAIDYTPRRMGRSITHRTGAHVYMPTVVTIHKDMQFFY